MLWPPAIAGLRGASSWGRSGRSDERDQRLDVLRGIAILLVVVRHSPTVLGGAVGGGVDIFLVLSGFLVSGILIREHRRTGRIDPWRFYLRRAFRIVPSFYVMLAVTAVLQSALGPPLVPQRILHEATFVQNYLTPWWNHTWSIALQEHFYLLLAPVLLLLLGSSRFQRAPARCSAFGMLALGLVLLAWRGWLAVSGAASGDILFKTHLRVDSLGFGGLVAIVWHLAPEGVGFVRRFRVPFLLAGLALSIPPSLASVEHPFVLSAGLTMRYVGYGLVLAAVLTTSRRIAGPLTPALAFLGFCSYSIYLWHVPVLYLLIWLGMPPGSPVIYFAGSLLVGIFMVRTIELPLLKLRDRWIPATPTPTEIEPRRALDRDRRLVRAAALAVVATVAGHLLLVASAWLSGADPGRNRTWVRPNWRCESASATAGFDALEDSPAAASACFPGYPAAVEIVGRVLALGPRPAGRLIAATCAVAALFVVALLLPDVRAARKASALLLAGSLPGFLWWHTVLPLSAVACLSLASIALGDRRRFLAAGACAAAAAFTHPAGVLVAVPLAIQAVRLGSARERWYALVSGPALALAGIAAAGAVLRLSTGGWGAWLGAITARGAACLESDPGWRSSIALHVMLGTLLVAMAAVQWLRYRLSTPRVETALLAHSALLWSLVLWGGPQMRLQLQAVALVGLVPLLGRFHPTIIAMLLAVSVTLGWGMSLLFFGLSFRA